MQQLDPKLELPQPPRPLIESNPLAQPYPVLALGWFMGPTVERMAEVIGVSNRSLAQFWYSRTRTGFLGILWYTQNDRTQKTEKAINSPEAPYLPNFRHKKRRPRTSFSIWWSRGDLNPRPPVLRCRYYMRSRVY